MKPCFARCPRRHPLALAAAAVLSSAVFVPAALAQDVRSPAPSETIETLDRVVATGTRLPGSIATEAAMPIQVIDSAVIEQLGATTVGDVLNLTPALRSSAAATNIVTGAAPTLNLRGMGSNRTLVLVNGRRHVAGVPGSAAVDISSIPAALIERVEVLTGGASAIYGSDAVTGVVNFILKDDFIGTDVSVQAGTSTRGDGERYFGSLTHGREFAGGRGHVMFSVQAEHREPVFYGDRRWARDGRVADDYANPALRFQAGDGVPDAWIGQTILVGGAPRYPDIAAALLERARAAAPRAYIDHPSWHISSTDGLVGFAPWGWYPDGSYAFNTPGDLDGNGVNDCDQSFGGRGGPGWVTGCWVVDRETGRLRPFQDGAIAGASNSAGGDGARQTFDNQTLYPEEDTVHLNLLANYEVSSAFRPYVEAKYSENRARSWTPYNTFDDAIPIFLDNPYIPDNLRALIDAEIAADPSIADTAMVTLARDHVDIYDPVDEYERKTMRLVLGATGEIGDRWNYDVALNYGQTRQRAIAGTRLEDRFFAALDAVIDPATGDVVCRSTLDPSARPYPSSLTPGSAAFNFGGFGDQMDFRTFTPGAGSPCRPLNLFGANQASAEALAFQNYYARNDAKLEQMVASAVVMGDTGDWFSLPGGPVGLVLGAEYRDERSSFTPDPYRQAGYVFQFTDDQITRGSYDVTEVYAEVGLPLLSGARFADTLGLTGAFRHADYSTIGTANTWKVDAVWAPVADVRFRASYAETIRAPNISELYSPLTSATFRPVDPCDVENINLGSGFREANCRAALGLPAGAYEWTDPLTARFVGQAGGNPDLMEESSTSKTVGVVLRPRFLPGFWAEIDYWQIEITDAIQAVTSQQIVNSCYDAPSLDNPFCDLFRRNVNPASPTFGGFEYLLQTQTNFAGLEARGVDFSFNYRTGLGRFGALSTALSGTYLDRRDNYPFPDDPDESVRLQQTLLFPDWSFNANVGWDINARLSLGWYATYSSKQYILPDGSYYDDREQFDPNSVGSSTVHNVSGRWRFSDATSLSVGVNNVTDKAPFFSLINNPAPAIGRYVFARVDMSF